MLRREHFLFEYRKGRIYPDRLMKEKHAHYLPVAERMLDIYAGGVGKTRQELRRAVEEIFLDVEDCPVRRIRAFCKLLDDAGEYDTKCAGESYALRKRIFERASNYHPLVTERTRFFDHLEDDIKRRMVGELREDERFGKIFSSPVSSDWKKDWKEIEARLFSDVPEFHRLSEFHDYKSAREFLARYNIAQIQAALYNATDLVIHATQDLKTILTRSKICGLMSVTRRTVSGAYEIRLNGPASLMRETRRYGVALAKFLPGLIACRGWRMHARLKTPRGGWTASLELSEKDGLHSHSLLTGEFDSGVEESFFLKWGDAPRGGWTLRRETEILNREQKVFFPDFVFYREDGRRAYLEIVGFWTPEYLAAKAKTLERFSDYPIILGIQEKICSTLPAPSLPFIAYKNHLKIDAVLEALERYKK